MENGVVNGVRKGKVKEWKVAQMQLMCGCR
jgi:hypothetical protein